MNTKTNQPVNKEAFRMLAHEIGLNAACRKLGIPIPTGKSWARRGGWELPKRKGGRPGRTLTASGASSSHPIADALKDSHKELAEGTRTALAQATLSVAQSVKPAEIPICSASHLKDLAAAAARVFNWEQGKSTGDTHNTLVITSEQLDQIRALRGTTDS